jgi:tetratricopeptide (TPR) repeat protein
MRFLSIGFAIAALSGWPLACIAGSPYRPASDAEILEQLAPPRDPRLAQLRILQADMNEYPGDLARASAYARAAIELGRQEQDPRDFGYAQSALAPWWNQSQPPSGARLLRATLEQWRHDFPAAIADLDAIIAADADDVLQAHLTRASLREVQGDPVGALRDCVALIGHTDTLTAETCITGANSLRGQATSSLHALDGAFSETRDPATPAVRQWALTEAAEISERLGETADAGRHYQQALDGMDHSGVRDPYLLAAWADFELDHGEPQAVIDRLHGLERIDNLLLRLALAEQQLAAGTSAERSDALDSHRQALADRFAETRQRGDTVHLREEAIFALELQRDSIRALDLAGRNWKLQREPADARILLAAALAAGNSTAAQPVLDWMKATRIEDVRLTRIARQLVAQRT